MLDWLAQHGQIFSTGVQIVTAIVWIVYLHVIVTGFRRQKRCNILLTRVAGNKDRAHMMVGNMGAEPIFVSAVMVEMLVDGETHTAFITDSDAQDEGDALGHSSQGPLKSAEHRDLGALGDITDHALSVAGLDTGTQVEELVVTVMAEGTYDAQLVAAKQGYWINHETDRRLFHPQWTRTRQIRKRRTRKNLLDQLDNHLRNEAQDVRRSDRDATGHDDDDAPAKAAA